MHKHLLIVCCVILLSCNTYVTQPIAKLLQHDWLNTPINFTNERHWVFDGSILTISDSTLIGRYNYTVENNLVKDYIYITSRDSFSLIWDPEIYRWRIIRINKKEMYLVGEFKQGASDTHRSFVTSTN